LILETRMTIVSEAVGSDFAAVHELAKLLYGSEIAAATPVRQAARTFVARTPDGVKGFLIATVAAYGFSVSGHLEEMAVAENEQGGGVGRSLVAACEDWLRSEGVETVFVSSLDTATGFYERLGYERCVGPWLFHRIANDRPSGSEG
jgi:N-acetylglutamate synthase-like GNAT family acetyltransferase